MKRSPTPEQPAPQDGRDVNHRNTGEVQGTVVAPAVAGCFATKQRERKLSVGLKIVWRYKGDKTWGQAYVKESFAKGKIVCLAHNEYASYGNNVAVADIDWHIK